jgi:putative ABC transport system permease protein
MAFLRTLYQFSKNLIHREQVERELHDEVSAYVEMLADEKMNDGVSPDEARRAAILEAGGVQQIKEKTREARPGFRLEVLLQDLRYGARMLRKNPGSTLVLVLTLALGMGANTAMFSSIDALVLRPVNFPDPDRLVALSETQPRTGFEPENVASGDFLDLKQQTTLFTSMAGYRGWDVDLTGGDEPEHLQATRVSADFFTTLGVGAALGRTFTLEEEQVGREQVAAISYGLWQRRFLGDVRVLGTDMELNGARFKVVGVMPAEFNFPLNTSVWVPLPATRDLAQERATQNVFVLARLRPKATIRQAQEEANAIAARLEQLHPDTNTGRRASVRLLREQLAGDFTPMFLWIGLGSVLFVLSMACVNVANMQLAQASERQREIAVRAALGASRQRIVRQLLTENVLLALMGGGAGIAVAWALLRSLKNSMPPDLVRFIPGWGAMTIDVRTLEFTFAVAILTGTFFGLAPALAASRPDVNEALKSGETSSVLAGARHRLRNLLVISEIALALVLLIGTGLMVKGFKRLAANQRQGFSPEGVLTLGASLNTTRYPEDRQVANFYKNSLESIRTLPDVLSAAEVAYVPSSGAWSTERILIQGRPAPAPGESQTANLQVVSEGYFRTLGIPLLQGRDFHGEDSFGSRKVAIISSEFARRYFGNANPLGEHVHIGSAAEDWVSVVGVAGDVRRFMFDRGMRPAVYLPHQQMPVRSMHFVVRTRGNPEKLTSAIRSQLANVDKEQPFFDIKSIETIIDEQISGVRVGAGSMAFYGLLALLLSGLGVYGVVAHSVQQRTREIGIRMAVGARAPDIVRMVVKQTIYLTAVGLGAGLLGAFAMGRLMAKAMFGIMALDPVTFCLSMALLATIALLASYVPARRAAHVDPMITLRCE